MSDEQYQVYYRSGYRDHIAKDGETVCTVRVREPEEDDLKPVEELTDREKLLLTSNNSNLCTHCRGYASRRDLFGEIPDADFPTFYCPDCGKPAERIGWVMGMGQIEHRDGTTHPFDVSVFERWRRGEDVTEENPSRTSPEEPDNTEEFAVYSRKQWKAITDAIETDDESLKSLMRRPSFGYLEEDDEWDDERFAVLTEKQYLRIAEAVETDDERVKSLLRLPYLDRLDRS
jgi:hypothetical protein